jgi:Ras family protein T1
MDLRSTNFESELEAVLTPNFIDFKQVELGIECTAKGYIGLIDILACAQKAVLFPIAPLRDSLKKSLRPEFDKALKRIFRILDRDNDGYLSDEELAEFQADVFGEKLQRNHITAFKEVLLSECENAGIVYDEAQAQKGITFEAFKAF